MSSNGYVECEKKPFFLLNHQDPLFNCEQVNSTHSMAHAPFPYSEPFFGSSLVAYGPQAVSQTPMLPQVMGLGSPRIALPLDLAEDGPIYVNAKQYHGILRRRQSRAKLEPYLHESRHRHALKRIRGSGGRFLSSKQLQLSNSELVNGACSGLNPGNVYQKKDASEVESHLSRIGENASSITTCSDLTSFSSNDINFRHPEHNFLGSSPNMGGASHCSGGHTFGC
ncbi:hypothetical protein PIB30_061459 [Stylosanthes scabra]|uniref:Nuclear transcription factor Y subunit n=1 Tax=Stylosanthes scabra TaxID=79078 RepID=A0ABU6TKQ2_9FABA|nr:hypothetical protein [Stylosanthes scabra]